MMIIDIDNSSSVQSFVSKITSDWFDIDGIYYDLKSDSQTNWTNFWNITDSMINIISNFLGCTSEEFLKSWEKKCTEHDAKLMGYHCTRHSNKEVFAINGILPLSEETISLSQTQERSDAENLWDYRSNRGPGPYFFLSYKSAKNPDNHFFKGPEILLAVDGHQPGSNSEKSIPFIIHCAIPFSILPDKNYYTFCILRAYFNFLDPEDDAEDIFDAYSIDLKGNVLDSQHVVRTEDI
ncbi:hypothetical protein MNBD_NITROSPIRAE03-1273 [hydrothermal vent metagenome]|uniref:Uncharacterized protein n=1 Tax=hydrothermal vent metagenome TaxID=652676 RepID=A0A3B1DCL9_9ZZZZ